MMRGQRTRPTALLHPPLLNQRYTERCAIKGTCREINLVSTVCALMICKVPSCSNCIVFCLKFLSCSLASSVAEPEVQTDALIKGKCREINLVSTVCALMICKVPSCPNCIVFCLKFLSCSLASSVTEPEVQTDAL
jgi:hypothetical protein